MSKNKDLKMQIAAEGIEGQPHTAEELINKYGTYEIQPTCDSDNKYPAIAQGLAKNESIAPKSGHYPKKASKNKAE